ncbi:hypothetical protein [Streptomyces clavifer]|uniref:hypothetical protein n=1 Tax=Streptomyces TaxID=1883 RepID=UPI00372125AA
MGRAGARRVTSGSTEKQLAGLVTAPLRRRDSMCTGPRRSIRPTAAPSRRPGTNDRALQTARDERP